MTPMTSTSRSVKYPAVRREPNLLIFTPPPAAEKPWSLSAPVHELIRLRTKVLAFRVVYYRTDTNAPFFLRRAPRRRHAPPRRRRARHPRDPRRRRAAVVGRRSGSLSGRGRAHGGTGDRERGRSGHEP